MVALDVILNKHMTRTTIETLGQRLIKRMKAQSLKGIPIADKQHPRDNYQTHQIREMMMKSSFGPGDSLQDESHLLSETEKSRLPTPKTVKRRLERTGVDQMTAKINEWTVRKLKNISFRFGGKKLFFAADRHDEPWYGDIENENIKGGKRKSSTSYFWGTLGLYLVHPIRTLLVAVHPIRRNETEAEVFLKIIKELKQLFDKLHNFVLLGDGKYYRTDLIRYLNGQNYDYIIRAHRRGAVKKWADSPRSAELDKNRGYINKHRLSSQKYGKADTSIVIVNRDDDIIALATSLTRYGATRVLEWYRRRFRIENCFRDMRPFLIRTSSPDPRIRFAYIFFAMILLNLIQLLLLEGVSVTDWALGVFVECEQKQLLVAIHTYQNWSWIKFWIEGVRKGNRRRWYHVQLL